MSILVFTRTRHYTDCPDGVFGNLAVDGQHFSVYCENADTLLPLGTYKLVPHDSPKHPNTLAFVNNELGVFHQPEDVPHEASYHVRTDCLIHQANWPNQLEGCCAPGETIARFPSQGMGVTRSGATMTKLMALLGTREGHVANIVEEWQS